MFAHKDIHVPNVIDRNIVEILKCKYAESCEKYSVESKQSFFNKVESINGLLIILCVFFWTLELIQEFISDRFFINVYVLIAMSITSVLFIFGFFDEFLGDLFVFFRSRKLALDPIPKELNAIDDEIGKYNSALKDIQAEIEKIAKHHDSRPDPNLQKCINEVTALQKSINDRVERVTESINRRFVK